MVNGIRIRRKLLFDVEKRVESKEIVVVTGMRRVGKTTLLRMVFDSIASSNKAFFDLENPLEQRIFEEKDFNNIWGNLRQFNVTKGERAYLFLDEIQAVPEVVKAVKYLHDHYDVKFFVTGSSSFYLKNLFPESLSGRKTVLQLRPLDFEEFLEFKGQRKRFAQSFAEKDLEKNEVAFEKSKHLYEEYLNYGGFPQVALEESNERKTEMLNDIFKSYFEKEVEKLADFRDLKAFRELLILLLARTGSKVGVSKLASEVGVSRESVYAYLAFLENTFFISLVPPLAKNPDREVSGAKKAYACDNGMASIAARPSEGALLENAVYQKLSQYGRVMYFQKRGGRKIDFVLPDEKIAFEVKNNGTGHDYKSLAKTAAPLGATEWYVITKSFVNQPGFIPAKDI